MRRIAYCHDLFQQAKEISITQTTMEQLWFPACSCCIVLEAKERWQSARPRCTAALGTHRNTAIHPADNESTGSSWLLTLMADVIIWTESLLGAGMSGCSAVSTGLAWPTSCLHSSNKASGLTDTSPWHSQQPAVSKACCLSETWWVRSIDCYQHHMQVLYGTSLLQQLHSTGRIDTVLALVSVFPCLSFLA